MGSSAQISSGVCRCESQEQVPEEGSRRFRKVPVCGGLGSGSLFRKVPENSGMCWCRFGRQVPEGSGEFWHVLVWGRFRKAPESSGMCWCRSGGKFGEIAGSSGAGSGRFRRVQVCAGVGPEASSGKLRGVPVQVPEGSGEFRCAEGSGACSSVCWCRLRFWRVPASAGVGSGGNFRKVRRVPEGSRKVLEGSGVCWCRFQR